MTASDESVVKVSLGARSYDIVIGDGLIDQVGDYVAQLRPGANVAIVTDDNVARAWLEAVSSALRGRCARVESIIVKPGESSKSWPVFEDVCERLIAARIERGDVIIALGGGVIGDLAGFAAASVRRGIDFIQMPTSLLAQVDSSVGGKTGINSPKGKNLIGAFYQPILVLADTRALDTLPPREFRAGYAEIVKYGLINDLDFFAWLEKNGDAVFKGGAARRHAVATCCRAKAEIVARDERETGDRALLNLGHTFGHAFEAAAGFSDRLLHGEAVALGLSLAFAFSERQGLSPKADTERVRAHLKSKGLPIAASDVAGLKVDADALMTLMSQDKKVRRGQLTFILARGIGQSFVARDVDPAAIREFLEQELRG